MRSANGAGSASIRSLHVDRPAPAVRAVAAVAGLLLAAEQLVELLGHELAMRVELRQEGAAARVAQRLRDPAQVVVVHRQHMGLLVVQVLDAVLDAAQELVGRGQRIGRLLRHQAGARQALQRIERGPRAQLGELAAAHHLQQLHGELDLADAAARQLHVVGALGPARRCGAPPARGSAGAACAASRTRCSRGSARKTKGSTTPRSAWAERRRARLSRGATTRLLSQAKRSHSRPCTWKYSSSASSETTLGPELPLGRSARSTRNTKPCSVVSPTSA